MYSWQGDSLISTLARRTNVVAVRFGNISTEPVLMKQPNGYENGLCYCVDMHSRTGFSGSPVFVYRTPGNTLEWALGGKPSSRATHSMLLLLGIHFGQYSEELPVRRKTKKVRAEGLLGAKSYDEYIEGMSGMTCVIPAWQITKLLNCEALVKMRKAGDVMQRKPLASGGPVPELAPKISRRVQKRGKPKFKSGL